MNFQVTTIITLSEDKKYMSLGRADSFSNNKTFLKETAKIKAMTEENAVTMFKLDVGNDIRDHFLNTEDDRTNPHKIEIKGMSEL